MPDVIETLKDSYVTDYYEVFEDLLFRLSNHLPDGKKEDIQFEFYEVGKENFESLRDWFQICYMVFLGKWEGPRLGEIISLIGLQKCIDELKERMLRVQDHQWKWVNETCGSSIKKL